MDGFNRRQYSAERLLEQTGCPPSFFRHLLRNGEIGIGSRLCVAENDELRLTGFLRSLGIETSACSVGARTPVSGPVPIRPDTAFLRSEDLCREEKFAALYSRRLDFDMVIVRDHLAGNGSLLSQRVLKSTAELLSILRPGGRLLFLLEGPVTASVMAGSPFDCHNSLRHNVTCYQRHLSCFPGQRFVAEHQHGLFTRLVSRWRGVSPTSQMESVALRIPDTRMPPAQWLRIVQGAAAGKTEPCCSPAAEATVLNEWIRNAA